MTTIDCIYKDWRFWLLFLVINMSGNLGFGQLTNDKINIIVVFIIIFFYVTIKNIYTQNSILFMSIFVLITISSGIYDSAFFSYSSTFHILMKMYIGVSVVLILRNLFIQYYIKIIIFFAIISLICFMLNSFGLILPYIPIQSTNLDGGNIMRVSSLLYTQLYNINSEELALRNCGPFWEPGAYQGFLNLAITLLILTNNIRDKKFWINIAILIVTIITTFSTGGYIVLFFNLLLLIYMEKNVSQFTKFFVCLFLLSLSISVFFNVNFMYEKIKDDSNRLGVTSGGLSPLINLILGYGYAAQSIANSKIETVNGLLGLFTYSGLAGIMLYIIKLIGKFVTPYRLMWVLIVCLILMNEPFLTAGPFWWGVPFIFDYYTSK